MHKRLLPLVVALTVALIAMPATADDEDDEKIAKQAVLKASDLPADWDSEPSPEGAAVDLPECEQTNRADDRADRNPSARSREFTDPDAPQGIRGVENSVWVFPNAKAAKRFFDVFTSDAAIECLQASGDAVAEEAGLGAATVEEIELPGVGDARVGYAALIGDGDPVKTIYFEIILVRVGRSAAGFTAENLGGSFPERPEVLDAVVGRLDKAL